MKPPHGATKMVIHFGDVYIESPGFPEDDPTLFTVWDPRPVRQGARSMAHGLSFHDACVKARALAKLTRDEVLALLNEEAKKERSA